MLFRSHQQREGEGEREEALSDRELTSIVWQVTARAGVVGGDGERVDVRRPEAEMTGTGRRSWATRDD